MEHIYHFKAGIHSRFLSWTMNISMRVLEYFCSCNKCLQVSEISFNNCSRKFSRICSRWVYNCLQQCFQVCLFQICFKYEFKSSSKKVSKISKCIQLCSKHSQVNVRLNFKNNANTELIVLLKVLFIRSEFSHIWGWVNRSVFYHKETEFLLQIRGRSLKSLLQGRISIGRLLMPPVPHHPILSKCGIMSSRKVLWMIPAH